MIIRDIENLIYFYGGDTTLNQILESALEKTPYKCPKCEGKGTNSVKYNAYPKGLPDSGFVDDWRYKDVKCDLCRGQGYTDREYKPKIIQRGWE